MFFTRALPLQPRMSTYGPESQQHFLSLGPFLQMHIGVATGPLWLPPSFTCWSAVRTHMGLTLLTASVSFKYLRPPPCIYTSSSCSEATPVQNGLFFCSLYLIALGTGGHKPCIEAFGADQFDGEDPEENRYRSSFFNWWYFGQCFGALIALSVLLYVEDYIGWGVGFGIPTVAMALALSLFLYGSKFYRHQVIFSSRLNGQKNST